MENICIEERKQITIIGATKVLSATNTQSVVEVGGTNLVITGTNLEVTKLDLDNKQVFFSGEINGVRYVTKKEKVGLFKRLFK